MKGQMERELGTERSSCWKQRIVERGGEDNLSAENREKARERMFPKKVLLGFRYSVQNMRSLKKVEIGLSRGRSF